MRYANLCIKPYYQCVNVLLKYDLRLYAMWGRALHLVPRPRRVPSARHQREVGPDAVVLLPVERDRHGEGRGAVKRGARQLERHADGGGARHRAADGTSRRVVARGHCAQYAEAAAVVAAVVVAGAEDGDRRLLPALERCERERCRAQADPVGARVAEPRVGLLVGLGELTDDEGELLPPTGRGPGSEAS